MASLTVATALHDLYSPQSTPRVRRRADSMLQQFQRSPEAAPAALRVLQTPCAVTGDAHQDALARAERVFAASTIYRTAASYVRRYKLEDPASWTDEERAEHARVAKEFGLLCHELWNILTGPLADAEDSSVQTQLALTIAVVLLRFHEHQPQAGEQTDPSIIGAVEWLVHNQSMPVQDSASSLRTNFAVLLTLKVIPEEVQNKRVKFSKVKRAQCEAMVQRSATHVIQSVLPSVASAVDASEDQVHLRGLLLQAFRSWVEYGTVSPSLVMDSGLLGRAFRETLLPVCSEDALLAIREVVSACQNDAHVPLMELVMKNFVVLGKHLAERIAALSSAGPSASKAPLQQKVAADPVLAACLTGCAVAISECGQSFITYFVDYTLDLQPGSLVYEFLDTVLFFTSLDDLDVSNETMEFWIDFRQYVSGKNEPRMLAFDEFISRLLRILVERTEFPSNFESFPEAARERFAAYRSDVRSVFRALATVTAASEDKFIVDAIHLIFRQYEMTKAGPVAADWWRRTEVYVHALSALSKSIREADLSLVPQLFDYLSQKEPSHRGLLRTTTVLLGVTSHWFARHPEFLGVFAFRILSNSFELSETDKDFPFRSGGQDDHLGAVALRKLTRRCGAHFFNQQWMESIIHLYRSNRAAAGTPAAILGSASLRIIVDAVAQVLATVSYKEALPVVQELTGVMFDDLKTRFPTLAASDDRSVEFLCELIEHLRLLVTQIPPRIDQEIPHPMLVDLQSRWELIETIMDVYGSSEEVVDKFCELLVGIFDTLRSQALELASRIMPTLLAQFAQSSDGNYLRVIKSIIGCAGDDEATADSLTRVVVIVTESALQKIAADGSVDENPALVTALLDLVASCGTHHPSILVQSNQLEPVLALVLHALKSQNPEVGAATLDFLLELGSLYGIILRTPTELVHGPEYAGKLMLHQLIQTLFFEKDLQYHVLAALFNAAAGAMPPTLLEKIAEVVRSCWLYFGRPRSEELLRRLLADDGFLGPHVASRFRGEFAVTISKQECIENSRKFKRVLGAFCDHFRRNLADIAMTVAPGDCKV